MIASEGHPLVSVIIPCYRQGHWLAEAINSALAQVCSSVEVIVVNDGSDDSTHDVATNFGDRIRYIHKENGGLPSARNAGLEIAHGKYVHFLDADDLLHPNCLTWMLEAMDDRDDRIVLIGYKFFEHFIDEEDARESEVPIRLDPFPTLIHHNFGPPNMLLMSRRMVDEAGRFNESLKSCEDWDMWLRLVLNGAHLATVCQIGAYYRRHATSMSKNQARMLQARSQVLRFTHSEFLRRPTLLDSYGAELLEAEHRVLRRWLATGLDKRWIPVLQTMIRELEDRGIHLHRSSLRRKLDRYLGRWSDVLALEYFRRFKPEKFRTYTEGCN